MLRSIGHATAESESLTPEQTRIERIALGLRTSEGIPLDLLTSDARLRARTLQTENLARVSDNRLTLVHNGRALVDPIAAELI